MRTSTNHISPAEIRIQIAKLNEIAIYVSGDDASFAAIQNAISVLKESIK